jgi:AcrR family transcriptional regulator
MGRTALREETREIILDAASRLVERYGYRKTTMEEIAREAGIGKGTTYLYFRSKEDVALSCVDRKNRRLHERQREIARSPGTPVERLREILMARVLVRLDSVQHYTQSLDELYAALRPAILASRDRYHEVEAQILAEVLTEGRRDGVFAFEDALAAARTLVLATNGLLPYSLSARELGERDEVAAKTSQIIDVLLHGLLSHSAPRP